MKGLPLKNNVQIKDFKSVKKPYQIFKYVWKDRQPFDKQERTPKTSSETLGKLMTFVKQEKSSETLGRKMCSKENFKRMMLFDKTNRKRVRLKCIYDFEKRNSKNHEKRVVG